MTKDLMKQPLLYLFLMMAKLTNFKSWFDPFVPFLQRSLVIITTTIWLYRFLKYLCGWFQDQGPIYGFLTGFLTVKILKGKIYHLVIKGWGNNFGFVCWFLRLSLCLFICCLFNRSDRTNTCIGYDGAKRNCTSQA